MDNKVIISKKTFKKIIPYIEVDFGVNGTKFSFPLDCIGCDGCVLHVYSEIKTIKKVFFINKSSSVFCSSIHIDGRFAKKVDNTDDLLLWIEEEINDIDRKEADVREEKLDHLLNILDNNNE